MNSYDALLGAYLLAKEASKAADEALEALRAQIMAEAPHSASERFQVRIVESTSERIESLKAIRDKSPKLIEALRSVGAIKTVVSTRLTVQALASSSPSA